MDEAMKQRIVEFNNQFGIKTEFITDGDVLGYSLGNTIYINENVEQDYERTNRHELLHFFEEIPEFEAIKKRLLEENADKLDEIRSEYELRYFGLYSEEEIKAGVLDTEIAIDMMVDNSSFEYEEGLKIGEDFLGQIRHSLEEKRYLNLSLNANIKNMNLSEWEKIFVLNYYDGKERKLPQGKDKIQTIRADIETYLQELYEVDKQVLPINPHSPEVIREYESEIKALKARGEDTTYLESNTEIGYNEIAPKISEQLYAEYKHIADLMKGLDIEPAFKSMMLRETLTKVYKQDRDKESNEGKTIVKNRKLNESIAGHMILNEQTLKFIYEHLGNIDEYKNFANLYFASVEVYKKTIAEKSEITLDGVDTFEKGKWIKFDGKGTDEEHYLENAKKLSALVQDTPWCTKQLASSQLADGDFYVFVDNEGKPHIAVKMNGNEIDEVRGIQNGNAQELEEEYRDVAISFLENNKDIQNGKEWLAKEEWNKRLIEYKRKIDSREFTIEDVPMLLEDCFYTSDYRSHGEENSNKTALKGVLDKIKGVLAEYYKCSEEEIYAGDIKFAKTKITEVPYRIILGNADFRNSQVTNLGQLQSIGGNADFRYSKVTNLGQLQSIGGNADFEYSKVTNLGQLQSIGGNAYFEYSQVTNLGQLQSIGGNAYFSDSKVTNLGQLKNIRREADFRDSKVTNLSQLQSIGGNANFEDSQVTDLGQLQSVGGNANFENSKVTDLGQLQSVGGNANFINSKVTNLGQLKSIGLIADFSDSLITNLGQLHSIGGDAIFYHSQVTNLGQLQSIGGDANFARSQVTDLGQLQSIGGNVYFSNSKVTNLGQLQNIGGNANFYESPITNLGQLQSIGGYADFYESPITNLGQLQSIGGGAIFSNSQITDLGQLQRIGVGANFSYSKVTNFGQLQNIGGYANFEFSQLTDLGQLQSIGGDANFSYSKVTNLGQLQNIGGNANFEYSQLTDLGQLQNIGGEANFSNSQITNLGQIQNICSNIVGSEDLKHQYELIKARKKATLSGQDIGQAGFGASVETCDSADRFINSQLEQNIEKRGEDK